MDSTKTEENPQLHSEIETGAPEEVQKVETLTFKVNDDECNIAPEHLSKWKQVFQAVLTQGGQSDSGSPSERLVSLPNWSIEDFEVVRSVVEGSRWQNLSVPQWVTVLKLATQGKSHELRKTATTHLDDALKDNHLEKLALGIEHKVSAWIIESASVLCQAGVELDLPRMATRLGWKTTARVAEAARFTSELSKLKPIVVPTTTLSCKCGNRLSYSLSPRTREDQNIASYEASSTMIVAWRPRKPERRLGYYGGRAETRGDWVCGQCVDDTIFSPDTEHIPIEVVLADLIPNFNIDNREIVQRIFGEELKCAY